MYSDQNFSINLHDGIRVDILSDTKLQSKKFKIQFINQDNQDIVYETIIDKGMWSKPSPMYFINWQVKIFDEQNEILLDYKLNLEGKKVLISFDSKAMGDNIAWLPYLNEFSKKHKCQVEATTFWNSLFSNSYKNIVFLEPGQRLNKYDAWYRIGCYDNDYNRNKKNWRICNLQEVACDVLGLKYVEIKPELDLQIEDKKINKKYICIAPHSTMKPKYWNYDNGWRELVEFFNLGNIDVVQVGKEKVLIPGVDDKTTDNIVDLINYIYHCEFFIGLGSGLTWLAWPLGKKVVMISGFSKTFSEFSTNNIRVINENFCHGCFNNPDYKFDRGDYNWCPMKKNFECTKTITPEMVINKIIQAGLIVVEEENKNLDIDNYKFDLFSYCSHNTYNLREINFSILDFSYKI